MQCTTLDFDCYDRLTIGVHSALWLVA
jgi:hypothetical protein